LSGPTTLPAENLFHASVLKRVVQELCQAKSGPDQSPLDEQRAAEAVFLGERVAGTSRAGERGSFILVHLPAGDLVPLDDPLLDGALLQGRPLLGRQLARQPAGVVRHRERPQRHLDEGRVPDRVQVVLAAVREADLDEVPATVFLPVYALESLPGG
jgi:hypothetical protein